VVLEHVGDLVTYVKIKKKDAGLQFCIVLG